MVRRTLKTTVDREEEKFTIFNYTDFIPQLEISRLPHDVRQKAYNENEYRVEDSASHTFAHTGQ